VTDLTKASEARSRVLRLAGINAPALTIGAALDAYAEAVRSDTLADVAARLPEALVQRFVESIPAEDIIVMQRVGTQWEVYHMRHSFSPRQSARGASLSDAILAHLGGPR
jgi:hypothetical protein